MEIRGQISVEFTLLIGLILIIILGINSFVGEDSELVQVMAMARSGATEAASIDSFAIYPRDSFRNISEDHPALVNPSSVKIVKIDYINNGFNATYNKIKIQLRITVSCPTIKVNSERNHLGDRINFYARKRISESFGTSNQTNDLFNPCYSNRYILTTADVRWI
ncbi:hypothetical protein [Methanobacterium sp. ACI-7]|uniref:hypothetical protein n=1 Tax=unclassified Methanobacterium TaxID=2627676 RepID=UPI0039C456E7